MVRYRLCFDWLEDKIRKLLLSVTD